jgi:hypothetical protein
VRAAIGIPLLLLLASEARADDLEPVLRAVKAEEQSAGFKPTGNFARSDLHVAAYYRCYYTGKLELPESYDALQLRDGTKDGCQIDDQKYDVFFYPIEAVSSGHAPVTQALAAATPERVATVVPHEDFHAQVRDLPDRIAEAASTLAGFLTGAAALAHLGRSEPSREAELFLRKAATINRYYDQLRRVYQSARDGEISTPDALDEKQRLFTALEQECAAIRPEPRSFNKCVSVTNNAGLAFDHTYTEYYPLLYQVFQTCRQDLRCTTETIMNAPKKRREAEVAEYFREFVAGHSPR